MSMEGRMEGRIRLTDITPKWGNIAGVVVPYESIDEKAQVANDTPADKEHGASVACPEM